jgi:hypothetical protein
MLGDSSTKTRSREGDKSYRGILLEKICRGAVVAVCFNLINLGPTSGYTSSYFTRLRWNQQHFMNDKSIMRKKPSILRLGTERYSTIKKIDEQLNAVPPPHIAYEYSELCDPNAASCININPTPRVMSIRRSVLTFCQYIVEQNKESKKKRHEKLNRLKKLRKTSRRTKQNMLQWEIEEDNIDVAPSKASTIREKLRTLNMARANLIQLVGFDAKLVVPSFSFLFVGALFQSISPHYWSKCITCVVSLDPSRRKLFDAMIGLAISSGLGAIFTSLRGAMFWIAGKSPSNCSLRSYPEAQSQFV